MSVIIRDARRFAMETRASLRKTERQFEHLREYWRLISEEGCPPEEARGDTFSNRAQALRALGITLSAQNPCISKHVQLNQAFKHYVDHNWIPLDHLRLYFRALRAGKDHYEARGHYSSLRYSALRQMVAHPTDAIRMRADYSILVSNWRREMKRKNDDKDEALDDAHAMEALYEAARKGQDDEVRMLLGSGVDVDKGGSDGATALYNAARGGHETVARLLIEANADVNKSKNNGWTPLMRASAGGYTSVVHILIEANADVNKVDENDETALHLAVQESHESVVRTLIESGARVEKVNADGVTALYAAIRHGDDRIVRLLLEAGADVNEAKNKGWTPLVRAAYGGHESVVRMLIEAGADVNGSKKHRKVIRARF